MLSGIYEAPEKVKILSHVACHDTFEINQRSFQGDRHHQRLGFSILRLPQRYWLNLQRGKVISPPG
jgi:hypothetical protein